MNRFYRAVVGIAIVAGLVAAPPAAADNTDKKPGFVDGSVFVDFAGDDAVSVELSLHGAILRAIVNAHPDLRELVGGLESIHAVVLDLENRTDAKRLRELIRTTERDLLGHGWERLARVKEADGEVKLLVLTEDDLIRGLVVLGFDGGDQQFVFANIAGRLDLEAIARIGEELDLPGLDDLR